MEGTFLDPSTGLLANFPAGKSGLFIDCSTIDPNASMAMHKAVADANGRMLDAPVSGGVGGAEAGTLTFMVGGEDGVVEEATPLLMDMGSNVVHCGKAGTGEVSSEK